jgi:NADP-dependent 3-hydroxy acid dehydrogenase YdfG
MTTRTFELADQATFAALSGDFNPMHVDPNAARRLLFGRPVVHGVHALLWGLDEWCRELDQPVTLERLRVEFQRPIGLREPVHFEVRSRPPEATELQLQANGKVAIRIRLRWSAVEGQCALPRSDTSAPPVTQCSEHSEEDLEGQSGKLPLHLPQPEFGARFPDALQRLPHDQLAILLASTRMVGMECPGLHSVYSQLALEFTHPAQDLADEALLHYRVKAVDRRFHLAIIELEAPGMTGTVRAFVRPAPRRQLDFDTARSMVAADAFSGRHAWVVGGSRGLGEVAAKLLAAGGAAVTITYHRGAEDAAHVVAEIRRGGGRAEMLALDVLDLPDSTGLPGEESNGPTDLLYFATPHIVTGERGSFSAELFDYFCRYYVHGFVALVKSLAPHGLKRVFYPSSIYADDPPDSLAEYGAAKAAGEVVCKALEKGLPEVVINRPRLPRMATDQTASLTPLESADPCPVILEELINHG